MDSVTVQTSSRRKEQGAGEIGRIVEQIRQVQEGGAWHGPSVGEAVEGLSAADAALRPLGAAHSIIEIVHHVRVVEDAVRRHITGEADGNEADWVSVSDTSETAWPGAVDRLKEGQRALRDAVAKLPAARLHENVAGKEHSYWYELMGLLHHDAYHAGQISLLKKGPDAQAVLAAPGRAPEIPESADLYGWLVGSWDLDVRHYWTDVSGQGLEGEAHFTWALEGRAVQDVWIMPRRGRRGAALDRAANTFGTTLRVWDPKLEAWRVTWINPVTGARAELVGRRSGTDIVQIGHAEGIPIRWVFSEVTPDSFRWTGEALNPDGRTWQLQGEFLARRAR